MCFFNCRSEKPHPSWKKTMADVYNKVGQHEETTAPNNENEGTDDESDLAIR